MERRQDGYRRPSSIIYNGKMSEADEIRMDHTCLCVELSISRQPRYCPPASSRRSRRRRNGKKNARWGGEERQGPACANGGKLPTVSIETATPAEKQNEKCPPVRRRKAEASVHTEGNCRPAVSRRPSRRRNGIKNARR